MNEHQLRCFQVASKYLNFTKAARDMFMTQAAMTYQINELEKQLGVALFKRTKSKIELTASGKEFLISSKEILNAMTKAKEELRKNAAGISEALVIGTFGDIMHPYLPIILRKLHEAMPNTKIQLLSDMSHPLVEQLNNDSVDIVFLTTYGGYAESLTWLEYAHVMNDTHVVLVPWSNPLSKKDLLTNEDLKGQSMIAFAEPDLLERQEDDTDNLGNTLFLKDPLSVRTLVSAGFGISVMVSHAAPQSNDYFKVIPLDNTRMDISACYRSENDKASLKLFLELVKEVVPAN